MKKTLVILAIVVIGIAAFYAVYMNQTEKVCTTNQDCVNKGIVCHQTGDQPTCIQVSPATGEEFSEGGCMCLNPNKEY